MALDSTEVRSYGSGSFYTAPVGSTIPTDVSTTPQRANGWIEHGHLTDAGPRFSFGKARQGVQSWQSFPDDVRLLKSAAPTTVAADLLQWNRFSFEDAFGGGTWSDLGMGQFKYVPPATTDTHERAVICDMVDGDYTYRFVFPRMDNIAATEFSGQGSALSALTTQWSLLVPASGNRWECYTDDPNAGAAQAAS